MDGNREGRIRRRERTAQHIQQIEAKVDMFDQASPCSAADKQNLLNNTNPPEIERIIRERKPRFESRLRKDLIVNRQSSSKSKGSQDSAEFQHHRAQRKNQILDRISRLNNRLQQSPASPRILIHDPQPVPRPASPSSKLPYDHFLVLLSDIKCKHQEQLMQLQRHHQLKVKSLESVISSKDKIIRQLQAEAALQREYTQRLEQSLKYH